MIDSIIQVADEVNQKSCSNIIGCKTEDVPEGVIGMIHINPDESNGGFVSQDSTVSEEVYLGEDVQVCFGANVSGTARILGNVTIRDAGTSVAGNPLIAGGVISIESGAKVLDQSRVTGNAIMAVGSKIFESGTLTDNALAVGNIEISGNADIGGNSFLVSFGDPTEKVEIKGNVKITDDYIIAQNAKVSGDFLFSGGPAAIVGHGVNITGKGDVSHANFSDNVTVDTTNLIASGNPDSNILVFGDAKIYGSPKINDSAFVFGNSTLDEMAEISGQSLIFDDALITNGAKVKDSSFVFGQAIIRGSTVLSGSSSVGANCVLEGGTLINKILPNISDPSDLDNQNCPGYYVPNPTTPMFAISSMNRSNYVETTTSDEARLMREEAYNNNKKLIDEAYKIREDFLNGNLRIPAGSLEE